MKQILCLLLLSSLLIFQVNCSNLRKLEETQSENPKKNDENNEKQKDEKKEITDLNKNTTVQAKNAKQLFKTLQLNQVRFDLQKLTNKLQQNSVQQPITSENLNEVISKIQDNQAIVEELKTLNKKIETIQKQLLSDLN